MADTPFIVQKVEWFQFRDPDGKVFFVMVASMPNGFYTAVPCQVQMRMVDHSLMALAKTPKEAIARLQKTLAGKKAEDVFPTVAE